MLQETLKSTPLYTLNHYLNSQITELYNNCDMVKAIAGFEIDLETAGVFSAQSVLLNAYFPEQSSAHLHLWFSLSLQDLLTTPAGQTAVWP